MGKEVDPSDIGKHPDLIKKAQSEINKMDVLVCGHCNGVFHFIDQFREHKTIKCAKLSSLKDNLETKPIIWAFLLWKTSQLAGENYKENTNAWKLYQAWVKLDEAIKETWIVAGRTIQSFARIGQGSLQEMPVKITKTVVDNSSEPIAHKQLPQKPLVKSNSDLIKRESTIINLDEIRTEKALPVKTFIRSPQQKPIPVNRGGIKPTVIVRRAKRTVINSANTAVTEEHTIEKILAKRFNPRHREHEYLIKWENISHELNTWEPVTHLDTCPVLLDTFEKQLARQKEQRQALAAKQSTQNEPEPIVKPTIVRQIRPEPDVVIKKRKIETPERAIQIIKSEELATVYKTTPVNRTNNIQSAEVVITNARDGRPTGIVKKTGVPQRVNTRNEAQVRFIPKGGTEVSGIIRIDQANKTVGQRLGNTTVKTVQSRVQPVKHVPSTVTKPTITRVTKTQPIPKQITPEQKIAALSRQGDLKITRRSVQSTPVAQTVTILQESEYNPQLVINDGKKELQQTVFSNRLLDQSEAEAILSGNQDYHIAVQAVKKGGERSILAQEQETEQIHQITDLAANPEELQLLANENLIQFVTGDDGTIYQVAGKNEEGHTILIAQGTDSDQQCVYVTTDIGDAVLGVDSTNTLQQLDQVHGISNIQDESGISIALDDSNVHVQGEIQHIAAISDDMDSQDDQITAEVVQADLPSPG